MKKTEKVQMLVTGAAGRLAQYTIEKLSKEYDIVAVDFRKTAKLENVIASYSVKLEKRGFEDVFRNHKIKKVLHLGRINPDVSDRFSRYNTNVIGTQKLLDLSIKYKVEQVIILSSHFVYGAMAYNPALLDEATPKKASELTKSLADAVELENLAIIYLWKNPQLNITLLRPCNIVGPGVKNTMSRLLSSKRAPVLIGFSPMMQFIHVKDMAVALTRCAAQNKKGIYNVAPNDFIAYQEALTECGCTPIPLPSVPPMLPKYVSMALKWKSFPMYIISYLKYPVVIDGSLFAKTFNYHTQFSLSDIFSYYRDNK